MLHWFQKPPSIKKKLDTSYLSYIAEDFMYGNKKRIPFKYFLVSCKHTIRIYHLQEAVPIALQALKFTDSGKSPVY